MGVTVIKETVFSLFFLESHFFADKVQLKDFEHMQGLLGGDCIALSLPCEILLWHTDQSVEKDAKHTLTIQRGGHQEYIFGNCLLTSNDEDGLNGMRSLSEFQMRWLGENHDLMESNISGDFVIKFLAN